MSNAVLGINLLVDKLLVGFCLLLLPVEQLVFIPNQMLMAIPPAIAVTVQMVPKIVVLTVTVVMLRAVLLEQQLPVLPDHLPLHYFNNIISLNISTDVIFFWILLTNFVIVVIDDCLS